LNPEPELQHRTLVGDIELHAVEWHRSRCALSPTLLMVHATGFHCRVWDQVIRRLPQHHAVALDQRSHGRSTQVPITHWAHFGEDLAGFVKARELGPMVGVGHSMGAHALVQAAAREPERFRALLLVDPVIASPAAYHLPHPAMGSGMHPAARRRSRFASAQEMIERFATRRPYDLFDAQSLHDYCTHGLLPAADGEGVELACTPLNEAKVYMVGRSNASVYASVRALTIPVWVIRARQRTADADPFDYSYSPTWPELAGEFRQGHDRLIPDRSHFLPMEDPDQVAGLISELIASLPA
jgi:pimeloyl-ACP methyl ester carboxylesterase